MRWSSHPEEKAWMLAHDVGQPCRELADAFNERFGAGLKPHNVSAFRSVHGRTVRESRSRGGMGGHARRPVGYERDTGKGYVLVKVAEHPRVPCSKDNWRPKHHLVWEEANGRPLPEGHEVMFADGDHSNLDPSNLVECPKRLVGVMNETGLPYSDADSLRAVIALARLKSSRVDAEMAPRQCAVCGAEFAPRRRENPRTRTCPACVDSGRKARGARRGIGETAECAVCGRVFEKTIRTQRRCPECIAEKPRHTAEAQLRARR